MLIVEQKICNLTEEQLKTAYSEFRQFKKTGQLGESLIRDLYNEYKSEIDVVGDWTGIELMLMNEVARRYYISLERYKELENKCFCLSQTVFNLRLEHGLISKYDTREEIEVDPDTGMEVEYL